MILLTKKNKNAELMLHTLAHLFLQVSDVFSPPFVLSPFISLATRDHVEPLKLPPSPASDLCLSRHVIKDVSSSGVHTAHGTLVLSGLESSALCLLRVAMYT